MKIAFQFVALVCLSVTVAATQLGPENEQAAFPVVGLPAKGALQKEWNNYFASVLYRSLVESYQSQGGDKAKLDEEVIQFLGLVAVWQTGDSSATDRKQCIDRGMALLAKQCTDPIVVYATARLRDDKRNSQSVIEQYEKAIGGFASTKYPRNYPARVHTLAAGYWRAWGDEAKEAEAWKHAVRECVAWLRDLRARGVDSRYAYYEIRDFIHSVLSTQAARDVVDQCVADREIDPWIAHTLEGVWEIRRAWELRGTEFAPKVTEKQWDGFAEHLSKARAALTAAHELRPDRPEAASEMITVSMGESNDDHLGNQETWFDLATHAQFDYPLAYHNRLWGLRPRWGGSYEEMFAFGDRCRASDRYDTDVPLQFVWTLNSIAEDSSEHRRVWSDAESYREACGVIGRYLAKAEAAETLSWYRSLQATISWWARDYAAAYEVLEPTGFDLSSDASTRLNAPSDLVARDILTYGGPAREVYAQMTKAADARDFAKVIELCEAAAERCKDKPEAVRNAAASLAQSARAFAEFHAGDWVQVDLNVNPLAWRLIRGDWRKQLASSVSIQGDGQAFGVGSFPQFGRRVEIETTFRYPGQLRKFEGFGVLVGFDWTTSAKAKWQSVMLYPMEQKVRIGSATRANNAVTRDWKPTLPKESKLRLQMWDDFVAVAIDDQPIFSGMIPLLNERSNDGQGIGFYVESSRQGFGGFAIKDARIRKLSKKPATQVP